MKLVDILARELKVWPDNCSCDYCCQSDSTTEVFFGYPAGNVFLSERADETEDVTVTRTQWQAAVDALKAENCAHLWVGWSDTEACELCNKTRKIVVEWNGEGLPPVGAVCEMQNGLGIWRQVEIFAHFKGNAFGWDGGELVNYISKKSSEFRPIRTPEQIAKQERSKACDKMYGVILDKIPQDRRNNGSDICEALYDAGYRKFEIVDN